MIPATLLGLWVVARLALVAGVDLGKDEVAYWYWARHLDASYAFLPLAAIGLADSLAGSWDLALRLPFVAAGTVTLCLMYHLCRLRGLDRGRSLYAAAALGTSHWIWHTSSFLHPDGFLVPAWLLALVGSAHARRGDGDRWWIVASVGVGLAGLSKYSGLVLGAGWMAALLLSRPRLELRRLLLGAVPAVLLVLPVLVDLLRTGLALPRALTTLSAVAPGSALVRVPLFALAPLLYVSPLLLWVLYRAAWRRARAGSPVADDHLLLWPGVGMVLFFGVFAVANGQVKGNWILPAFLGLWPAAFAPARRTLRRAFPALLLGAGLLHAAVPAVGLRAPGVAAWLSTMGDWNRSYRGTVSRQDLPREPTYSWTERVCEYHGWEAFGAAVDEAVAAAGVDGRVVAASAEYGLAFGLARYADRVTSAVVPDDPRFARLADDFRQAPRLWARRSEAAAAPGGDPRAFGLFREAPGCEPVRYELKILPRRAPAEAR